VDRTTGELFPMIGDVEPRLRREVELRREAQEQAALALEQARRAQEEARLARDEARRLQERAEREAAARQALEAELARLRSQRE
jgi:hypothetical protein